MDGTYLCTAHYDPGSMDGTKYLLIMILGRFSKYLHEIYGASFCTEYAWGGILRKFTGLKEGTSGENIFENTLGWNSQF